MSRSVGDIESNCDSGPWLDIIFPRNSRHKTIAESDDRVHSIWQFLEKARMILGNSLYLSLSNCFAIFIKIVFYTFIFYITKYNNNNNI